MKKVFDEIEIFLGVISENSSSIKGKVIQRFEMAPLNNDDNAFFSTIEEDVSEIEKALKVVMTQIKRFDYILDLVI